MPSNCSTDSRRDGARSNCSLATLHGSGPRAQPVLMTQKRVQPCSREPCAPCCGCPCRAARHTVNVSVMRQQSQEAARGSTQALQSERPHKICVCNTAAQCGRTDGHVAALTQRKLTTRTMRAHAHTLTRSTMQRSLQHIHMTSGTLLHCCLTHRGTSH